MLLVNPAGEVHRQGVANPAEEETLEMLHRQTKRQEQLLLLILEGEVDETLFQLRLRTTPQQST